MPEFEKFNPNEQETLSANEEPQPSKNQEKPERPQILPDNIERLLHEYRNIEELLNQGGGTQQDKLHTLQLKERLAHAGVYVGNKTEESPQDTPQKSPKTYSRRTVVKAGAAAGAAVAIGGGVKSGWFARAGHAIAAWNRRVQREADMKRTTDSLNKGVEAMAPPTPTPTEAATPTPSAEQLAYQEFQTEIDRYLNKFVEMGEDEELGAGGAMPLVMVADRFTVDELVAYAKEAGSHGDFIDPEEAAYFTAAGLENGIDPVAASEMFSQVTDDLGIADQRTAALVAIAMKYSVDAKQVADDLYPITKSTQARGSITLLPLYYQGYSVEQIDELFKEVQDLTKEQYNDGIDEVVTYLQAQDVLPAQQMYELMDHVKDGADTIRDLPALYLALTIHIGKSEEEVFEQFERLKDQMEGLRSSVKESAAAVLILKAASRDSTIAGIQDIVSESNYAMSAWWSLFGPNGLMPIKF